MKALIVEDEVTARDALRSLLEREGFTVSTAETCLGALKQLGLDAPDIVLLDIDLDEELNGIDIATAMSKDARWRDIPVIVTSGVPANNRTLAAFAELRALMVPKPIEASVLLHEMRGMLGAAP